MDQETKTRKRRERDPELEAAQDVIDVLSALPNDDARLRVLDIVHMRSKRYHLGVWKPEGTDA